MFKKVIIIIVFIFFAHVTPLIAAQPLVITLNQQQFQSGDKVNSNIKFNNIFPKSIKGVLICDFISLNPDFPPMPQVQQINLPPGGQSEEFNCVMNISEAMPTGLWRIEVEARDEYDNLIIKNNKEFTVIGTKKEIKADLLICADRSCNENKVVFVKGDIVYLKLSSTLADMDIDGKINNENIIFKKEIAEYKAVKEGSYEVKVKLKKEGYIEKEISKNFAIISAPAKIESKSICIDDGICTNEEKANNCPQDCQIAKQEEKGTVSKKNSSISTMVIGISLALFVLIIAIMFWIFKKRNSKKSEGLDIGKHNDNIDDYTND